MTLNHVCYHLSLLRRLLILWFDYGHWSEVYEALVEGIKTIQIDTWLQVQNINHFMQFGKIWTVITMFRSVTCAL